MHAGLTVCDGFKTVYKYITKYNSVCVVYQGTDTRNFLSSPISRVYTSPELNKELTCVSEKC